VDTESGPLEADIVVSALNANALAKLLPEEKHSVLRSRLSSMPSVDVATAILEYPRDQVSVSQVSC